jgi:histidinol dehydrogenase
MFGEADVDLLAGPSEVVIVADQTANAACAAADMIEQAEHDAMAASALVTDDESVALNVRHEVERQLDGMPREAIARESLSRYGLILLSEGPEESARTADLIAPEHLELMVADPDRMLGMVRNAGAVFLGTFAPESLGDYIAGPSHTLPTGGTARAFSGVSVWTFLKRSSLIGCNRAALRRFAPFVKEMALAEGLEGHWRSYESRLRLR